MTATEREHAAEGRGDDGTVDALGAQRDFLLRSLADLDAERAAGELAEDRYHQLHDRYTVEAATVLRALDRLNATTDVQPARAPRRLRVVVVAVAVVAVLALAVTGTTLLVRAAGTRQMGQTITGNAQSGLGDLAELARAARTRPEDAAAQLAYASALMDAGSFVDALKAFDTAARIDPANPVPKAYGGWIVFLAGLTDKALARLDAAVAADPSYPDAHFFRGMVLLRGRRDQPGAEAELREYLRLAPDGPERDQVRALLADLATSSTTTVP